MNCGKKVVMEDAMSKESFIYFTAISIHTIPRTSVAVSGREL